MQVDSEEVYKNAEDMFKNTIGDLVKSNSILKALNKKLVDENNILKEKNSQQDNNQQ